MSEEIIQQLKNQIKLLQQDVQTRDVSILELQEKASLLKLENDSYNIFSAYPSGLSDDEKKEYDEQCQRQKEEVENSLDDEEKKEYDNDMELEDILINNALILSQLQYETSELFHELKGGNLSEDKYKEYKKHKRNFYAAIDSFYRIYDGGDKLYIFDILVQILRKQRRVYKLDEEIKELSK